MSYARWSDSDVYVFHSVSGHLDCCPHFTTESVDELERHLQEHVRDGDMVDVDSIMAQVRADFPSGSTR